MTFTIDRKGESLEIPIKPAEAPDGTGRIGVQLAANAQVSRRVSKDPLQAVQLAAKQFGKLTTTVVSGEQPISNDRSNRNKYAFQLMLEVLPCHCIYAHSQGLLCLDTMVSREAFPRCTLASALLPSHPAASHRATYPGPGPCALDCCDGYEAVC